MKLYVDKKELLGDKEIKEQPTVTLQKLLDSVDDMTIPLVQKVILKKSVKKGVEDLMSSRDIPESQAVKVVLEMLNKEVEKY